MAETVYLLDGTMEVVFTEKDVFIELLIREKLGDDAARFVSEYIRGILGGRQNTPRMHSGRRRLLWMTTLHFVTMLLTHSGS